MTYDFLRGYKTVTGLLVVVLSFILAKYTNEIELTEIFASVGQILGALLTVYGLVMKIIRRNKK